MNIKGILNEWLEIEFYKIGFKLGFIDKVKEPDTNLIYETIRCLDRETSCTEFFDNNLIITIIALMWEHVDREIFNLKDFIIKILSRIGYPTSAIIVDAEFEKDNCRFSNMNSLLDEITTSLNQYNNEVNVGGKQFLLTDFQMKIWDAFDTKSVLGISAPTSAGKSFALLLKTVDILIKEKVDIIYIVPTLSLVNQVSEDYIRMIKKFSIQNCNIYNSYVFDKEKIENRIFVLTQEKALAAFMDENKPFDKKAILIVDEIQNIEHVDEHSDTRSKILYDTIIEFRHEKLVYKMIISGPRIEEIDTLGKELFGKEDVIKLQTNISPVLNLTYSISKENKKYFLKQYCAINDNAKYIEIIKSDIINGYGNKAYTEEYLKYLAKLVNNIGGQEQNIIFAPTSDTASKIASFMADNSDINKLNEKLKELITYYSESIHTDYAMCKTLEHGIAYHHGKLPNHIRRTLEKAISQRLIANVACTTTLMQGVNMPAQNVIIRNPHLYIKKNPNSGELSSYEMANLRGRAGRLLKDFIGRTYVLDESEFGELEDYKEQTDLFNEVTKEIATGYSKKYEEYEGDICSVLNTNKIVDNTMQKYGYLISYIRQVVLKYGNHAKERLEEVGIDISLKQINIIANQLKKISVPYDVCIKNRYWDPMVLDVIYNEFKLELPTSISQKGLKGKFDNAIKFLRDNEKTKHMYEKYIPKEFRSGQMRSIMCGLAISWMQEKSLKEIFEADYYSDENATEKIDSAIELLQNTISFSMPLLLKPMYDMFKKHSVFLSFLQTGAFQPYTRRMIEIGIPRETAIYLFNNYFKGKEELPEEKLVDSIKLKIKEIEDELPYWVKVQLEFLGVDV
ncbi:MAG TPA: hypothetical protein DCP90_07930 [Clostridiales bacterium]|nr:MAG: hypothetical protein A2Y22_06125 [Clostridiales bacterium GWD2_32_59]HAN10528.1 hypothetical protein [Clostridiales bacterium]